MQHIRTKSLVIPSGKFSVDDEQLKKKREALKKKLQIGEKVVVEKSGNVNPDANANTGDSIQIKPAKLAVDNEQLKKKREELKKKLQRGDKVVVEKSGNVNPDANANTGDSIQIKPAKLALDNEQLKKKREELKEKLRAKQKVVVEKSGNVNPDANSNTGDSIQIKPAILAFYWYEENPELLQNEIAAMKNFFPQFQLDKFEEDGRLYWHGTVEPHVLGGTKWYLQLIYDNSHPHNNNYGGSVKVYSIDPDLDEVAEEFYATNGKVIPHLLTDNAGHKYMCTSEKDNFLTGSDKKTSAATCLVWALKWIACFEILMSEEGNNWDKFYSDFATHGTF